MKCTPATIAAIASALALAGCGGGGAVSLPGAKAKTTAASETRLGKAAGSCSSLPYLADAGASIAFDTEGEEDTESITNATVENVACVLGGIKVPDYVITQIDATSAMDGPQEASWDGFTARWKYHPDSGLNLTVVDTQMTK